MTLAILVARNLLAASRRRGGASSFLPIAGRPTSHPFVRATVGRSFSTDRNQDWLPPDRPLVGDKGLSELYKKEDKKVMEQLEKEAQEETDEEQKDQEAAAPSENVDWLRTRRKMLSDDGIGELTVKEHTLLSREEIVGFLKSMGGQDIIVMHDELGRFGSAGLVVVTSIHTQLVRMAQVLRKHLRARGLHERNVIGAIQGIDGDLKFSEQTWLALDCGNYVVHFQDEKMRKDVNIEAVWSGKDGVHLVSVDDDDAVDDYVFNNPVPEGYGESRASFWSESDAKSLKKTRWTKRTK